MTPPPDTGGTSGVPCSRGRSSCPGINPSGRIPGRALPCISLFPRSAPEVPERRRHTRTADDRHRCRPGCTRRLQKIRCGRGLPRTGSGLQSCTTGFFPRLSPPRPHRTRKRTFHGRHPHNAKPVELGDGCAFDPEIPHRTPGKPEPELAGETLGKGGRTDACKRPGMSCRDLGKRATDAQRPLGTDCAGSLQDRSQ